MIYNTITKLRFSLLILQKDSQFFSEIGYFIS